MRLFDLREIDVDILDEVFVGSDFWFIGQALRGEKCSQFLLFLMFVFL